MPVGGAVFVVVSGPPGSGKSTVAAAITARLELPLIAKDTVKEALMSVLPVPTISESRRFGRAAVVAMLAVAAESPRGAVLESTFYRTAAGEALARLPGPLVEVFCRCDRQVASDRYRQRAGSRHAGHFELVRGEDELWNEEVSEPVAGGWTVIEVNTNDPVDTDWLIGELGKHVPPRTGRD